MWCTDDRHPNDLIEQGHIDYIVRRAIKKGLDPVTAVQMATINPSEYFEQGMDADVAAKAHDMEFGVVFLGVVYGF